MRDTWVGIPFAFISDATSAILSTVELGSCASAAIAVVTTNRNTTATIRHKMVANTFLTSVRCSGCGDWIRKNGRSASAALRPNENKMSGGQRERALLEVKAH